MTTNSSKSKKNQNKDLDKPRNENGRNILFDSDIVQLQPSREMLDFYRRKVVELTNDHDMVIRRLEKLNEACVQQHRYDIELKQREEEISDLQKALSDMQVYLFKEREQVLRLYSENDRLKIRELEDRRKIAHLLQLSGLTQSEVTYFIKDPPNKAVIEASQAVKMVTSDGFVTSVSSARRSGTATKNSNNSNSARTGNQQEQSVSHLEHESVKRDLESCKVQIQALQSQLEEQTRLYKEQTDALMEDRRIRTEETEIQRNKDSEKLTELSDKLKRTQELLYENTKDFLSQRNQYREKEKELITDKDSMYRKLQLKQASLNNLGKNIRGSAVVTSAREASGSNKDQQQLSLEARAWTEAIEQARSQEADRQRSLIRELEWRLNQQQELGETVREEAVNLEGELSRARESEREIRQEKEVERDKLLERLHLLGKRHRELGRRRALEAEGFRADIEALRKKMKGLEKQLYTVTLNISSKPNSNRPFSATSMSTSPDDLDLLMLSQVKQSTKRANHLSGQLKDLKAVMYGLERELKHL